MGFFKDLKNDISQVVNQMLDEDSDKIKSQEFDVSNAEAEAFIKADAVEAEKLLAAEAEAQAAVEAEAQAAAMVAEAEALALAEAEEQAAAEAEALALAEAEAQAAAEALVELEEAEETETEQLQVLLDLIDEDDFNEDEIEDDFAEVEKLEKEADELLEIDGIEEEISDIELLKELDEFDLNEMEKELATYIVSSDLEETNNEINDISGKEDNMEFKEMTENTGEILDETTVITQGMTIKGNIISKGSADISGVIEGNVDLLGKLNITGVIRGDSKAGEVYADGARITGQIECVGSVKVGSNSVVIGDVIANSAVIAGAVKGNIDVQGPVILDATAIVMGDIKSKSVQINNGAVIEGMCSQCYAQVSPTSFFDELK